MPGFGKTFSTADSYCESLNDPGGTSLQKRPGARSGI